MRSSSVCNAHSVESLQMTGPSPLPYRLLLFSADPSRGTLMRARAVVEALQISVLVLICVSLVMALCVVWWDDHKWLERL